MRPNSNACAVALIGLAERLEAENADMKRSMIRVLAYASHIIQNHADGVPPDTMRRWTEAYIAANEALGMIPDVEPQATIGIPSS